MKKTLLFLSVILFASEVHSQNVFAARPFSVSITNPQYQSKQNPDLNITNIELDNEATWISFIYDNTQNSNIEHIWLNTIAQNALYIRADDGREYNLLNFRDIGSQDNKTTVPARSTFKFQAKFSPLPANTQQFDLIEGRSGNIEKSFSFYRVQMRSNHPNVELVRVVKDYNSLYVYNNQSKTWGEYTKENNTVIFNSDSKRGAIILLPNGALDRYSIKTVIPRNDHQEIHLIDSEGLEATFYLYPEDSKGLRIQRAGRPIIQLARR